MSVFDSLTWSMLGSIGRSSVSKLSMLMPFVGYLILLQDKVVALATPLIIQEGTDFRISVGFYLLYFGLFIFGLGSFLFHVAAPHTAKDFKSADDYVEKLQGLVSTSELIVMLDEIILRESSNSNPYREATLYRNTLAVGIGAGAQQPVKVFTLRAYFHVEDKSRKYFIFAVFFLFLFGVFLTFIPSIIVLIRVASDFYRNYIVNLI